jgi:very-short-patch-repair endonuclease
LARQPGEGMNRFKSRARRLRTEQPRAEEILWRELRNRQLGSCKFRRQHPIGAYIVDFVSLERKLVIEVDGATHSTDEEVARDARRTTDIESFGFHVVRVTNTDIYKNLDGVLDWILLELGRL